MKVNLQPYDASQLRPKEVEIVIEGHDLWNLDYTLALIILAGLESYKSNLDWSPTPDFRQKLDLAIESFTSITSDKGFNFNKERDTRHQAGLNAFAEILHGLWN